MSRLVSLTGGRAWAARLIVTLAVLLLGALVVVVMPASAAPSNSPPTGNGVQPESVRHVGGDAVEDCDFAATLDPGPDITGYAFSSNPSQTSGDPIQVTTANGEPVDGVSVTITVRSSDPRVFDYVVTQDGTMTWSDTGLEAPRRNSPQNLSHVSVCLAAAGDNWVPVYVEVKGARDTNHYANLATIDCGHPTELSTGYQVTLQLCDGKSGVAALFTQGDDYVLLETFSAVGSGYYIEHLEFDPLPAVHPIDGSDPVQVPFVLKHDDQPPLQETEAVPTPQCAFNPDADGNGLIDTGVDPDAALDGSTTCFFTASFIQQPDGDWISSYDLLNLGDGWRGVR